MDVPHAAEPPLALPPSRFVAERNALAKALGAQGRRADLDGLFAAGDRLAARARELEARP